MKVNTPGFSYLLSLTLRTLALFTVTLFLFRSFAAHRNDAAPVRTDMFATA